MQPRAWPRGPRSWIVFEVRAQAVAVSRWTGAVDAQQLVGFSERPLAQNPGSAEWAKGLGEAFQAWATEGWSTRSAVLAVTSPLVVVRRAVVPRVRGRARLVEFEAARLIPYPLNETAWGWTPIEAHDDPEAVWLAAMRQDIASVLVQAARSVAGDVVLVPGPLALMATGRRTGLVGAEGTLLFDQEADSAMLAVLDRSRSSIRSFETGGDSSRGVAEVRRTVQHHRRSGGVIRRFGWAGKLSTEQVAAFAAEVGVPAEAMDVLLPRPLGELDGRPARAAVWFGVALIARGAEPVLALIRRDITPRVRPRALTLVMLTSVVLAGAIGLGRDLAALRAEQRHQEATMAAQAADKVRADESEQLRQRYARARQEYDAWAQHAGRARRWVNDLAALDRCASQVEGLWLTGLHLVGGDALDAEPGRENRLPRTLRVAMPRRTVGAKAQTEAGFTRSENVVIKGRILDPDNSGGQLANPAYERFRAFIEALRREPGFAELSGERFDPTLPGLLDFEVRVVRAAEAKR